MKLIKGLDAKGLAGPADARPDATKDLVPGPKNAKTL